MIRLRLVCRCCCCFWRKKDQRRRRRWRRRWRRRERETKTDHSRRCLLGCLLFVVVCCCLLLFVVGLVPPRLSFVFSQTTHSLLFPKEPGIRNSCYLDFLSRQSVPLFETLLFIFSRVEFSPQRNRKEYRKPKEREMNRFKSRLIRKGGAVVYIEHCIYTTFGVTSYICDYFEIINSFRKEGRKHKNQ